MKDRILKWLYIPIGMILVCAGLVTFWLPIPIGLPLMMLGIPILVRHSPRANRILAALADRVPLIRKFVGLCTPKK